MSGAQTLQHSRLAPLGFCPVAFHGQYQATSKKRSIVIGTVTDKDLYLRHFHIGLTGTTNDLNVMAFSSFSNSMTSGSFPPPLRYTVNRVECPSPYVLCDGIYPKWAILIDTLTGQSEKRQCFASRQEGKRKDAERINAYLLQAWKVLKQPARCRHLETLLQMSTCCAVLHSW